MSRSLLAAIVVLLGGCSLTGSGTTPSPVAPLPTPRPPTAAPTATAVPPTASVAGDLVVSVSADGYLVGPNGLTLYVFDNDSTGTSACTGGCAQNWPPLTSASGQQVVPDPAADGTFGSIARSDGSTQVTFNDRPLYYFAGDTAPGDTNGDGLNGVWHLASVSNPASSPTLSPADASPQPTDRYDYNY